MYLCITMCMGGQKRTSDLLDLELQLIMIYQCGYYEILVLFQSSKDS